MTEDQSAALQIRVNRMRSGNDEDRRESIDCAYKPRHLPGWSSTGGFPG